jgi:hypothetical protein
MVDISLESAFHSLEINPEPFFHPRKGFESRRGSETENFYVVMEGRIPGIYTHWCVPFSPLACQALTCVHL